MDCIVVPVPTTPESPSILLKNLCSTFGVSWFEKVRQTLKISFVVDRETDDDGCSAATPLQ